MLRSSINDPDPRVQATSIEALDRIDHEGRAAWTLPKLGATNSRVRANAVKSLLRLEVRQAGEALLDMLSDASASHRLSALWVVDRLRLHAVFERAHHLRHHDPDPRVRRSAAGVCETLACARDSALIKSALPEAAAPIGSGNV